MVDILEPMTNNKYEKILLEAAHLINQNGFKETSFQEIADKVGLHKTSLFHYFENKEELLLRILEKSTDLVSKNLGKIVTDNELEPEEKLKKAIYNHLMLMTKFMDDINIYLNELRSLSKKNRVIYIKKRKKYENDFEKIIAEMKTKGYFKRLDAKIVTFGILGMLNWVGKWYKNDGALTIEEVSNIFYRILNPVH